MDAFDPRSTIISQIGYTKYLEGDDRSTVSVLDDRDDTRYLPLYLPGEARTGQLPTLPFIEVNLMTSPHTTMNIAGDKKLQEIHLDFNIMYSDMDNITASTFGTDVANELCDLIFTHRCDVSGCTYMEVVNAGREIIEATDEKQVIFHRVVEIYAMNYE